MASVCLFSLKHSRSSWPRTLCCLLLCLVLLLLSLQGPEVPLPTKEEAAEEPAQQPPGTQPPTFLPSGSACVANASANAMAGFAELPPRMQDFLRYRHCRHFPRLLDAPAKCAGRHEVTLLLAVKSAPAHYERRELIRRTWGRERSGVERVRRLFLLGAPPPEDAENAGRLLALVALEAREHGDVLQWDFADTFLNLTLKHVHLLTWLAARCPGARFVLSCDDDVFVHTPNVLRFLRAQSPDKPLFAGQLMEGSVPIRHRDSKYFVPPQLFAGAAYPIYCSGGGFLMSRHTVRVLRAAAHDVPLFPIDDAYMGMCLQHAGLRPTSHSGIRPFGVQVPGSQKRSFDPCIYRELLLVHRFAPYEMLLMWEALRNPGLHCARMRQVT